MSERPSASRQDQDDDERAHRHPILGWIANQPPKLVAMVEAFVIVSLMTIAGSNRLPLWKVMREWIANQPLFEQCMRQQAPDTSYIPYIKLREIGCRRSSELLAPSVTFCLVTVATGILLAGTLYASRWLYRKDERRPMTNLALLVALATLVVAFIALAYWRTVIPFGSG